MKKGILFFLTITIILASPSCKKIIDDQKENYILRVMTSGRWYLKHVNENAVDITTDYEDYEFRFYKNGTLEAIKSSETQSGKWSGDFNSLTFTSDFPASGPPLQKLNKVWKIKDYYPDMVKAEALIPNGLLLIQFKRK